MEVTESNLAVLAQYLQQTLDPQLETRKSAEKFLENVESSQNYAILLLSLIEKDTVDMVIRVAGAVTFRNYVKRNWFTQDNEGNGESRVHIEDRNAVKTQIVSLMLKSPAPIQRQLSDAVSIIGKSDFPADWPQLIDEMVNYFATGDFHVINGVLQTAQSLFNRYRYEFKSEELWKEIKYVLDRFAKPLTELFVATLELATTHANNASALNVIFSSLVLISNIFYCLNYQDLPEFFEDNMNIWFPRFLGLLTADNALLQSDSDEEPGVLEELKSSICDSVALYALKYDEEFRPLLPQFVQAIWQLLTSTSSSMKYDNLVSNAINFLSTVAERPQYKNLFEDPQIFGSLCEKVIMPNMEFRKVDEEQFEDNPEEYVRRDIEGSDVDTRRRASCDFVRALSKNFEKEITDCFSSYIGVLLNQYNSDNKQFWKSKDIAIYLVTSLAVKAQTVRHGTTQISSFVNIPDYFNNFILPELQNTDPSHLPVIKADCIKFEMIFRNQIPKEYHMRAIPLLIQQLTNPSFVIHTYAAACLEKLFMLKEPGTNKVLITQTDIQPFLEPLLKNLFGAMQNQCSVENEYVMKSLMRTFSLAQHTIVPYLPTILQSLTEKLMAVSKNPSKPHFNHYLFEVLCLSVKIVCSNDKSAVASFEAMFFPIFQELLTQDVQEFIPYVFQLLSMMLEFHQPPVPSSYMGLFPCLLVPLLWERQGNIQALVRLIQAFIDRGSEQIIAMEKLSAVLGVFQKLIASKANDHHGFYIIQSLVENIPEAQLKPYVKQIFVVLFQRLTTSKTLKLIKGLLVFFNVYAIRYGGQSLQSTIDDIQPNLFGMVLNKLYIAETQKVSGDVERKICAVGMVKILTESQAMLVQYADCWTPLLEALIKLIEAPEDKSTPDDEHFIDIEDTPGYQAAYSELIFAGKKKINPIENCESPRVLLTKGLQNLSSMCPGKVMPMMTTGLSGDALMVVESYLKRAGITIS